LVAKDSEDAACAVAGGTVMGSVAA
jgi:hypothetical protein